MNFTDFIKFLKYTALFKLTQAVQTISTNKVGRGPMGQWGNHVQITSNISGSNLAKSSLFLSLSKITLCNSLIRIYQNSEETLAR